MNAAMTLYAQWVAGCTVTAETYTNGSSSTAGGSVTGSGGITGAGTYDIYTHGNLIATANSGYTFVGWDYNDDGVWLEDFETDATWPVGVYGDYAVRAKFASQYTVTVTIKLHGNVVSEPGWIEGAGTYDEGSTVYLELVGGAPVYEIESAIMLVGMTPVKVSIPYTINSLTQNMYFMINFELASWV